MNYQEAVKLTDATPKLKDNFMVIKLNYDFMLVLPYKAGVAFMEAVANAEQLYQEYNKQHRICAMDTNRMQVNVMSHKEYREYKIAALMGIKVEEVKEHQLVKETV